MEQAQIVSEKPMPFASTACKKRQVLFLCTGNYYRSRFAELLFNARAKEIDLKWSAFSRGLIVRGSANNAGPVSVHALDGLAIRGIPVNDSVRFPMQVQEQDFAKADLIIALRESEHRLYLERRFPTWAGKVEYWHVGDLDVSSVSDALSEIELGIEALIRRLYDSKADGNRQPL
jgi:protein-tyrosine phosphatase